MSRVTYDSIWTRKYGVVHGNPDELKRKPGEVQKEKIIDNEAERNDLHELGGTRIRHNYDDIACEKNVADKELKELINCKCIDETFEKENNHNSSNDDDRNNTSVKESKKGVHNKSFNETVKNETILEETKKVKNKLEKKPDQWHRNINISKRVIKKRYIKHENAETRNFANDETEKWTKEKWQKPDIGPFWLKNCGSYELKKRKKGPKWRLNSGVLISLVMLNVAGFSSAIDTSGFSSALTSRMIASFLGYPATCSLGAEVRPCTLTLTCWLRGGTRLRGCGGWLFSCCGLPEPNREGIDNSILSSDWKYKMSPPKLRQVPQRSVIQNNVFRRRVDDDVSQMECGLPSSRVLQKRIIGGREARFAEFPWQAHVRISEFQCGGVLVSRWFVATAAHCVSRAHTRDIAVWLGAIDTSATHYPARKIGVVQKILHPLFQFRMTQPDRYDIALLKLSRPISYMYHILPICLPDHDLELRGRSGVIAGWGKTDASNGHTGTNLLRSATVPILSKEQCIKWHQSKQISVEIHSEMICAGHSDGHQDACLGDSGGPLIVFDNGRYYLVGITSAGFGCGVDHQPGIYHNVKLTANWIRGVISPSINYIDS